ncbi:MAG: hypothetical protein GY749_06450 [Desulfobacteraceae bacterium]|nr:hypothetical protein [Desulfobacteraceae bacterium]
MKISDENLRNKYASLDNKSLLKINSENGLTVTAKEILREELLKRNLHDQVKNNNKFNEFTEIKQISFVTDFVSSIKNSAPLTNKMVPSIYSGLFLVPIICSLAIQSPLFIQIKLPHYITFIIGYLPILGVFLFVNKAHWILEKEFEIPKPKYQFLLLLPVINMFYQYWSVLSLGQRIRKAISISSFSDIKFKGLLSEFYCHIFIALNIVAQINIHFKITNQPALFMLERITRGLWIYVTVLMIWDYSKIVNIVTEKSNSDKNIY